MTTDHPPHTAGRWTTRGFSAFSSGTCGNAGQNLYVSREGVLQRIHLFDANKDGFVDLIFCNSQDHREAPPAYVYRNALGSAERIELPTNGASCGDVADINGDGYADLLLGMGKGGNVGLLNAYLYFGSPQGWSPRQHVQLPAHYVMSAAIGDFNGDGRPDLALAAEGRLRLFHQSALGFEPGRFLDLPVQADQIGAADLDGDGFADLFLRDRLGKQFVYWGGPDGLNVDRMTELCVREPADTLFVPVQAEVRTEVEEDHVRLAMPLPKIVTLSGRPHLLVAFTRRTLLVPVAADRSFGAPLVFACGNAMSVAAGDLNGDGWTDLVFAARDRHGDKECSWVYWGSGGSADGFSEERRTPLYTHRATDVAVGDLDGNGLDDVAIAQHMTEESYTVESLIFRGGREGLGAEPVRLLTHGARRVFIARTSPDPLPQVIFINQLAGNALGAVDSHVYWGGSDGFAPDRRTDLKGQGTTAVLCCDLNDNGWPDILLVNSSENAMHRDPGSFVFRGGPHGFKREPDQVIATRQPWGVSVADLNRDGYLDLVFSHFWDKCITIYYGGAEGVGQSPPQRIEVWEDAGPCIGVPRCFLADMNNDGWLDIIVSPTGKNRCTILWGGPDGFRSDRRSTLPISNLAAFPYAADLNGNGWLDLIVGGFKPTLGAPHDSFTHIFWNGPEGLRQDRQTQLPSNAALGIAVADFNNDGYRDLFTCSYQSVNDRDIDAYIYWNAPGGQFSATRRTLLRTHSSAGCLAADFNEDGFIDLAVANHKMFGEHIGESFVFWNGPQGFDERKVMRLPTVGPHGMFHVQPGNLLTGGSEEFYTSAPFKLPAGQSVRSITWEAELPRKTWVKAQFRFALQSEALEQADWRGASQAGEWLESNQPVTAVAFAGQWVQYRLALGAINSGCTPRIREVNVVYAKG